MHLDQCPELANKYNNVHNERLHSTERGQVDHWHVPSGELFACVALPGSEWRLHVHRVLPAFEVTT